MKVSEYFRRIFPCTNQEMYYPSRKNYGIFVSCSFTSAGSSYFNLPNRRLTSEDVPLGRKIYDGRPLSADLKASIRTFDCTGFCEYCEKIIDKTKYRDIMQSFGIPPTTKEEPALLRKALAEQFKLFVDGNSEEADDIVAMTYQQYLSEPDQEPQTFHHISSLYPDDIVYLKPEHKRSYLAFMYEKIEVTWQFSNLGKQTWRGRKLYLANHDKIRPRAENNYVEIPDTPPKTGVEIHAIIDTRGFQEKSQCHWIMIDEDGNDCFEGSRTFDIEIDVKFKRKGF